MQKGRIVHTTQFPHEGKLFRIATVSKHKPIVFYAKEIESGERVNLVASMCFEHVDWRTIEPAEFVRRVRNKERGAVKEYVRRFKRLPKF